MNSHCELQKESLGSVWKALSMDSTSIITQVNKDDDSVEVSPYTQNKRKYLACKTSILLILLRYEHEVTGANFALQRLFVRPA